MIEFGINVAKAREFIKEIVKVSEGFNRVRFNLMLRYFKVIFVA